MNTVLVSVTERSRETGLRMAVGARGRAILQQFLAEAIVLSTVGGAIGVGVGALGALAFSVIGQWPTVVSANSIVPAVLFSAVVGVF